MNRQAALRQKAAHVLGMALMLAGILPVALALRRG
jgi:hypothetical protein